MLHTEDAANPGRACRFALGREESCFGDRAAQNWPRTARSPRQGAALPASLSLAGPSCWLVTSLANCMGARLAKLFHIPKLVLSSGLSTINNIGQTRGSSRSSRRKNRKEVKGPAAAAEEERTPPIVVDHRRPPPPDHTIAFCVARRLSADRSPTHKILPRRALLQPCDLTRVREGFAIFFHRSPTGRFESNRQLARSKALCCYRSTLFPARRFSLSRRPFFEHHPTAANNQPGPTVQTVRASKLNPSLHPPSLHPPPTAGR